MLHPVYGWNIVWSKIWRIVLLVVTFLLQLLNLNSLSEPKDFLIEKKAMTNVSGFNQHEKSIDHKLAIQRWVDHKLMHAGIGKQIGQIIYPSRIRIVQSNREYLRKLFEMHRFFTREEQSYR